MSRTQCVTSIHKEHAKNRRIMNAFLSEQEACDDTFARLRPAQPQKKRVSPTNHARQTRQPNTYNGQNSEARPKEEVPGFSGRVYPLRGGLAIFSPDVEDLSSFLVDQHSAPRSSHSSKTVLEPVLASPRAATDFRFSSGKK